MSHALRGMALFSLLAFAGCGSGGTASKVTPPVTPVIPPSIAKAPLHGLVAMGDESFVSNPALTPDNSLKDPNANPGVYVSAVILVTWKQLQATSGASIDTSAIESGLAAIATYNAANPNHKMVGKLRVFAGVNTPTWAMNLDGPPVAASLGTFPRYWTPNYIAAWTNLQKLLAATYDTDSRLGEVAVSGCSTTTAEPFIHDIQAVDDPLFRTAGYTDAQFMTCLSTMATQYAAWTITPLDYTFNPFNRIDMGSIGVDDTFPITVMTAWRNTLGTSRGVIANHGLQPPTGTTPPIYQEFTVLGPPLEFQSVSPTVDWPSTIATGLTYHPTEIEIWPTTQGGGHAVITLAQLQLWASEI